ncbi:hypothetical protein [Ruegeria arenilitoris]|uniref:hypothetical protein n=1 Tax=Ruegeria arenilitoris TaxID=1173585 RepID=UPI001481C7EB|nr:hypothetical protein [Ruegeria arenilitoris]
MSDFKDTSHWTQKDGTTLAYTYEIDGEKHERTSEKVPNSLLVQLDRLSVLNETSWQTKDEKEPEGEADYSTQQFITAHGKLDNCFIHAITLDEHENDRVTDIEAFIYPADLEKLRETSTVEEWSILRDEDKKPEDGWLSDEIGRITYHSEGEYYPRAMLTARLFLSQDKFEDLVREIKAGNIRSARLQLLADVYQQSWEGMVAGPDDKYNYAILCEDEGDAPLWGTPRGAGGFTKARLQEVLIEWSPDLKSRTAGRRDQDDFLEPEYSEPERQATEQLVAEISRDLQSIRGRLNALYSAAFFVAVILVISQVIGWLGF